MAGDYEGRAHFAVVYMEEAHPTDGWMTSNVKHRIAQHTSLEQRAAAATVLESELASLFAGEPRLVATVGLSLTPVLVDGMDNLAATTFGALPERLAILVDGELRFLGGRGPDDYSLLACRDALDQLLVNS